MTIITINLSGAAMTKIRGINVLLVVSGQTSEEDISNAAREGFEAIINLHPVEEPAGGMTADKTQAIASSCGLACGYSPVKPAIASDDILDDFARLLSGVKRPTMAYQSGRRSAGFWALLPAGSMSAREMFGLAATAGIDHAKSTSRSEQRALCHNDSDHSHVFRWGT